MQMSRPRRRSAGRAGTRGLLALTGAAAVLCLFLGLPWLLGQRLERSSTVLLERLAAHGFEVAAHSYQRRWFEAESQTRLIVPAIGQRAPSLVIHTRYRHFPDLATLWHWPPGLGRLSSELRVIDATRHWPAVSISAIVGIFGDADVRFALSEIIRGGQAWRFSVTGVQGRVRQARMRDGRCAVQIDAVLDRRPNGRELAIDGVVADLRWDLAASPSVTSDFAVQRIAWRPDASSGRWTLRDVRLNAELVEESPGTGVSVRAELAEADCAGYACGFSPLELSLTGLPPRLAEDLSPLWSWTLDAWLASGFDLQAAGADVLAILAEVAMATPSRVRPRLEIAPWRIETASGPVDIELAVDLMPPLAAVAPTDFAVPAHLGDNAALAIWLARLRGGARLELPRELARQGLEARLRWRALNALEETERHAPPGAMSPSLERQIATAAAASLDRLLREGWLRPTAADPARLQLSLQLGNGRLGVNQRWVSLLDAVTGNHPRSSLPGSAAP